MGWSKLPLLDMCWIRPPSSFGLVKYEWKVAAQDIYLCFAVSSSVSFCMFNVNLGLSEGEKTHHNNKALKLQNNLISQK